MEISFLSDKKNGIRLSINITRLVIYVRGKSDVIVIVNWVVCRCVCFSTKCKQKTHGGSYNQRRG